MSHPPHSPWFDLPNNIWGGIQNMKSTLCNFLARFNNLFHSVWLQTGLSGFDPPQWQRIFPLTSMSRPALRPTQPPIQWVPGSIPRG
jgi:hypothetical protein